jgi:ADP-ribose pyrophosphatase
LNRFSNFLIASMILLLAWSSVFVSTSPHPGVQIIFAALGTILSAFWIALSIRVTELASVNAAAGRPPEGTLISSGPGPLVGNPFIDAAQQRNRKTVVARLTASHVISGFVPTLFLLVYLILLCASLRMLGWGGFPRWAVIAMMMLVLGYGSVSLWFTFRPSRVSRAELGFCSFCGCPLKNQSIDGRARKTCTNCGRTQYQQLIVGAGAFIENDGRLLLLQRANEPYSGYWGLPAGHVEADENPEQAAIREVEEETGLLVRSDGLSGAYFFEDHPRGSGVLLVYKCTSEGGQPVVTAEASAVSFFAPVQVPSNLAGGGHSAAITAWVRRWNCAE